jgi:hypothetical protein
VIGDWQAAPTSKTLAAPLRVSVEQNFLRSAGTLDAAKTGCWPPLSWQA